MHPVRFLASWEKAVRRFFAWLFRRIIPDDAFDWSTPAKTPEPEPLDYWDSAILEPPPPYNPDLSLIVPIEKGLRSP